MTENDKARFYDEYVRQAGVLERENSKLKSQYVVNIPEDIQNKINENMGKINTYQRKLQELFNQ